MCDILVLAFQTDTTRVTTLKLNNDHSSLRFPNLGVDYMIHHLLSHTDSDDWLKVNRFFVEQLAYIARKLDGIQEGERTALDNSMIMFCSSMMTGGHDASQLPVVMVGRRRRQDQDRPRARLSGQAESAIVPAVPVDARQDRHSPGSFWRRRRAAGGGVRRAALRRHAIVAAGAIGALAVLPRDGARPMMRRPRPALELFDRRFTRFWPAPAFAATAIRKWPANCASTRARRCSPAAIRARPLSPGKPDESLLLKAIQRADDVSAMPPDKALRHRTRSPISRPGSRPVPTVAREARAIRRQQHWAFEPVARAGRAGRARHGLGAQRHRSVHPGARWKPPAANRAWPRIGARSSAAPVTI